MYPINYVYNTYKAIHRNILQICNTTNTVCLEQNNIAIFFLHFQK